MRDSNPRGLAPNPLSKSANRGPRWSALLRLRLRSDRSNAPGWPQTRTTETKTETAPLEPPSRTPREGSDTLKAMSFPPHAVGRDRRVGLQDRPGCAPSPGANFGEQYGLGLVVMICWWTASSTPNDATLSEDCED